MALFRKPIRDASDEQLVQRSARGDERAFSELYDRYAGRVFHYFFKMLWKDREMAEDFTQELFLKVVAKGSGFDNKRSFKPWLFSIAHNMCKNAYRHHEVEERAGEHLSNHSGGSERSTVSTRMDHETFRVALDNALDSLDEDKRTTFRLRFDDDMSVKEIGETMACSEGTVKSRIFYTLKHLNAQLQDYAHLLKDKSQ